MVERVDVVVIGAGPNGLVAANFLASAGWDVVVVEQAPEPGGAVRSGEITAPGFVNDLYSAFYPLAAASPVLGRLDLADHGLRWATADRVIAHARLDGPAAVIDRDVDVTVGRLEQDHAGDGEAWAALNAEWDRMGEPLLASLFTPFPPLVPAARLALRLRTRGVRELVRTGLMPARTFSAERFGGDQAKLLVAGLAMHTDLSPLAAGSAIYGWLLAWLAQSVGFPVPVGGAGRLTDALVGRLAAAGGSVRCSCPVERVLVVDGAAVGVATADGSTILARRAVIADTSEPALYGLVGEGHLPAGTRTNLARRAHFGAGTVKVDWALRGPIPWTDPDVARAGTVHLAPSLDALQRSAVALDLGDEPDELFVIVGQMTTVDPTRSPAGTESAWAYTHVPNRPVSSWTEVDRIRWVTRIESEIERYAPGFLDLVISRASAGPAELEAANPNLVGGAIDGGTAQPFQQLVFRPVLGWGRPETPIRRLYLGSAAVHPGGGVHGACGANAAHAAILHDRLERIGRLLRPGSHDERTGRTDHAPSPSSQ